MRRSREQINFVDHAMDLGSSIEIHDSRCEPALRTIEDGMEPGKLVGGSSASEDLGIFHLE